MSVQRHRSVGREEEEDPEEVVFDDAMSIHSADVMSVYDDNEKKAGTAAAAAASTSPTQLAGRGASVSVSPRPKRKKRLQLPTATELAFLPKEVRQGIMDRVFASLRSTLYGRVSFLRQRQKLREDTQRAGRLLLIEHVPVSCLQACAVFSTWSRLEGLSDAAELLIVPKGTILVHADDPSDRHMYVLMSGSLQILRGRRSAANPRAKGCDVGRVVGTIDTGLPAILREHAFLSLELPRDYIRTSAVSAVWRFPENLLLSTMTQLTEERAQAARAAAIGKRQSVIPEWAPLTVQQLAEIPLFKFVPRDLLTALLPKLVGRTIEANQRLSGFAPNDPKPAELLLLLRGVVHVTTRSGRVIKPKPGSLLQTMPVLFPKKQPLISVATRTICDFYSIHRDSIKAVCGNRLDAMQSILKCALDDEELRTQRSEFYRSYIATMPFVAQLASKPLINDLLKELRENVYPPGSSIVSTSQDCDGIIIPIRGIGRISIGGMDLTIGECIGFACLTPHRWAFHVTARDAVETIEISREAYSTVLEKHGMLARFATLSTGLLYPVAYPVVFAEAVEMIQDLTNQPTFPVSESPFAPAIATSAKQMHRGGEHRGTPFAALVSRKGKSAATEGAAPPVPAIPCLTAGEAQAVLEKVAASAMARSSGLSAALLHHRVSLAERYNQQLAMIGRVERASSKDSQNGRRWSPSPSPPVADQNPAAVSQTKSKPKPAKKKQQVGGDEDATTTGPDEQARLVDGGAWVGADDASGAAPPSSVHLLPQSPLPLPAALPAQTKPQRVMSLVEAATQTDASFMAERSDVLLEMLE